MKLLLENWRGYLLENKELDEITVGDLEGLIEQARKEEKKGAVEFLARILGKEGAMFFAPVVGAALGLAVAGPVGAAAGSAIGTSAVAAYVGGDALVSFYNKLRNTPEGEDTLENFPVLKILKIDPYLVQTIEDDILNIVDEKYQEYLKTLDDDQLVSKIESISDFTRRYVAQETGMHVAIYDHSNQVPSE